VITHDIDEALVLSDRVIVLKGATGAHRRRAIDVDLPRPERGRRRIRRAQSAAARRADRSHIFQRPRSCMKDM